MAIASDRDAPAPEVVGAGHTVLHGFDQRLEVRYASGKEGEENDHLGTELRTPDVEGDVGGGAGFAVFDVVVEVEELCGTCADDPV